MPSGPVDRVVSTLEAAGFRVRESVLRVATVDFQFAAVLTAETSLDLVVVVDTLRDKEDTVRRKLESLSSALDVIASRRPITAVLVGPPPRAATLDALLRTGRVLLVGTPVGEGAADEVRDALAVLLPLQLPALSDPTSRSWEEMRALLERGVEGAAVTSLVDEGTGSTDIVRAAWRAWLSEPLADETSRA